MASYYCFFYCLQNNCIDSPTSLLCSSAVKLVTSSDGKTSSEDQGCNSAAAKDEKILANNAEDPPASPTIMITPEGGQTLPYSSPGGTPKVSRRETFNKVKRNESVTRTRSFSKKYELSPDLHDRSVQFLERQYGGKEKANWAACVIQMHYRKYAMNKRFQRMRTYSVPSNEFKARQKSARDPNKRLNDELVQTTPVIKIRKQHLSGRDNHRVRSILIIDNINSPSGSFSSEFQEPIELSKPCVRTSLEKKLAGTEQEDKGKEETVEDVVEEAEGETKEKERQSSVTSETEHYVKIELVQDLQTLPDGSAIGEEDRKESSDAAKLLPNGTVQARRPIQITIGEESEFDSGILFVLT